MLDGVDRRASRARRDQTPRTAGHLDDAFEQALTIVYRMLFLLFAEARALVPVWHPVYRESYSLEALRAAVERSRTAAVGLWDALRAIARLAHAGCRAGDLRVTPFNGRLFAPARTPLAERRDLDDEAARRAVLALSTRPSADRAGRERIAYRDLGVEQLGAVYETLLDYRPAVAPAPASDRGRAARRSSAPDPGIAQGDRHVLHAAADRRVSSSAARSARSSATPRPSAFFSSGSSIRRWGAARFSSRRAAFWPTRTRRRSSGPAAAIPSDIGERERAAIRRTIAERCLYGVDLNPMAVQLARLSLWLTTLAADRPLSFLDHHLQVGDSLLGAWLAVLRRAPPAPATTGVGRSRTAVVRRTARARRAARGAAGALLARVDAQRHAWSRFARRSGRSPR